MYNKRFTDVYYYELTDVLKEAYNGSYPPALNYGIVIPNAFKTFLEGITDDTIPAGSILLSDKVNKLWCENILTMYRRYFCSWLYNKENTAENRKEVMKIFVYKLCSVIIDTYAYYTKLIDLYEAEQDKLMDDVQAETTNRLNDTPQNGGDYRDDNYTSTYSKTISKTNVGTKINRLDEIKRLLPDLYSEWARQFKPLFEVNVYD